MTLADRIAKARRYLETDWNGADALAVLDELIVAYAQEECEANRLRVEVERLKAETVERGAYLSLKGNHKSAVRSNVALKAENARLWHQHWIGLALDPEWVRLAPALDLAWLGEEIALELYDGWGW
jgi:hypothetical protein